MTRPGLTRRLIRPATVDIVTMSPARVPAASRPPGRDLPLLDLLAAPAIGLLCVYAALEGPGGFVLEEAGWISVLVGALLGLPLAIRRRWPVAVLTLILAVASITVVSGIVPLYASSGPVLAVTWALYTVGARLPRRGSLTAAIVTVAITAASLLGAAFLSDRTDSGGIVLIAVIPALAWIVGRATRERQEQAARVAAEVTEHAVSEERLHIARELHDIVAHSMSVIAVKAAVANHVADERPQETRDALRVIELTSREALAEMRRTFRRVAGRDHVPARAGPGRAAGLADRAETAGIRVELTLTPPDATLPAGLGLAVYRIVQEALTNVVRHAGPASCRVTVLVRDDHILVEVTDDGAGPTPGAGSGGGQGLIGMRERTVAYGGDFSAGPGPQRGFTVTAHFPRTTP
jgi:signal transduction histidine kinase